MVEGFSGGVGGEAQDLAARDSRQARGAVDEEEAQGFDAGDAVAVSALAGLRLRRSQTQVQLEARTASRITPFRPAGWSLQRKRRRGATTHEALLTEGWQTKPHRSSR